MCSWICARVRVQVCLLSVFCFSCGDEGCCAPRSCGDHGTVTVLREGKLAYATMGSLGASLAAMESAKVMENAEFLQELKGIRVENFVTLESE